jgi:hypothetical protein
MNSKDLFFAWLAGVIDTGGSISIKIDRIKRGQHIYEYYCLYVRISDVDSRITAIVSKFFGCKQRSRKRKSRPSRESWDTVLRNKRAVKLLAGIMPYLIVKREHAKTGLEFGNTIHRPGIPLNDEEREKRREVYLKMDSLPKNRGHFFTRRNNGNDITEKDSKVLASARAGASE